MHGTTHRKPSSQTIANTMFRFYRALQTISYREESEKLNVWVAYLNLENMHGSPDPKEAVLTLFRRALAFTDQKKLHLALLGIYERTGQHEMADTLFKSMNKKFNTSAKVGDLEI
jgi:rRNA biogenesis protein RRP5